NLMNFLFRLGQRTKSLLLATATPVQLHPIEAWDLLRILSEGNDGVLGGRTRSSPWYQPSRCLAVAQGQRGIPEDAHDGWQYVRDPLPAADEDPAFRKIRRALNASDQQWQFAPETIDRLPAAVRQVQLINHVLPEFAGRFNPLLRCIVRRTRGYLESTINPATGSYFLPRVSVRLFGESADGALTLGGYLLDAYHEAETFCRLLQKRVKAAGFFKTLLLRRLGSSMEAGRRTVTKLLSLEAEDAADEEDDFTELADESGEHRQPGREVQSELRDYTEAEAASLERCLMLLQQGGNRDPKLEAVLGYLLGTRADSESRWLDAGCILFSQYYDTARWVGEELAGRGEFADQDLGLDAGSGRSGFWRGGVFQRCERDTLKQRVRDGSLKILLGTDAASEGLNLQRLGTLINIDLPWNPTRLEQRKGRIQRIGQSRSEVWVANLRYRGSVEDRVHEVLADRLEAIHDLFGQIPDTLEDVWVQLALDNEQAARQLIDRTASARNPFDAKYSRVEDADWETCSLVMDPLQVREELRKGW
ncbi:MAG: helicase-related protein, partial [Planctomyces sp.]